MYLQIVGVISVSISMAFLISCAFMQLCSALPSQNAERWPCIESRMGLQSGHEMGNADYEKRYEVENAECYEKKLQCLHEKSYEMKQ